MLSSRDEKIKKRILITLSFTFRISSDVTSLFLDSTWHGILDTGFTSPLTISGFI